MDKNYLFYRNNNSLEAKNSCMSIPARQQDFKYLLRNNFLSEYGSEEDQYEVLYNLGILLRLDTLKKIIDAKVILSGDIPWDIEPTSGNSEHILSSDALYKTFAKYVLSSEVDRLLYELSSDYNKKIGDLLKQLNFIPRNRGEYIEGKRYYEGNLVQYRNGTYIAHPEDYDENTNPLAYITDPPFGINPEVLNSGWEIFARGSGTGSSDGVTNVAWDDNDKKIVLIIGGRTLDVITAEKLKEEVGGAKINYNSETETLEIN